MLFGNEVNWRGQPHGTFKLLFNGIYYGSATTAREARGRPISRKPHCAPTGRVCASARAACRSSSRIPRFSSSKNGIVACGTLLAAAGRMASPSVSVERLWSMDDGTLCLLVERDDAPRFEICVVRDDEVLRQNRLYARGSAQMLAETWRSNLSSASDRRVAQRPATPAYGWDELRRRNEVVEVPADDFLNDDVRMFLRRRRRRRNRSARDRPPG